MDIVTILLIAFGLAMDTFAVSIATGITTDAKHKRRNALVMASFFGGFQMLMPLIGWAVGLSLQNIIVGIDHWIAFGLLTVIGGKMIYDSTKKETESNTSVLRIATLVTLAVATSIDALMVGLSFAFLQISIVVPIVVIGVVTFSLSVAGFIFGHMLGQIFEHRIKIVGGLVLIAIGLKILIDHLLT
jgi:putative Mn2+ efflux pump MntP